MATHNDLSLYMIQVRHPRGTLKLKVDHPDDTVFQLLHDANDKEVLLDCQAKDVASWAKNQEGFEAAFGTIILPEVNLDIVIDTPGFRSELNLGAVCDTGALWTEVRASGGVGTVFTAEDVAEMLEEDREEFQNLSEEERKSFLDENLFTFTKRLEDILSERGNNFLTDRIADEFEDAYEDFQRSRSAAPVL